MEGPVRRQPLRAVVDPDHVERIALLGGRRWGEPVPVEAVRRHPSQADPEVRDTAAAVVVRLDELDLARRRRAFFAPLT